METKQAARKILLQAQNKNKALRDRFCPTWNEFAENECEFLDLETSLALWDVAIHSGVARKEWSHFIHTEEFERDLRAHVEDISRRISTFENIDGFCLTYFWRKTGAILTDLHSITKNFNELMFLCEDEINFYSSDFKKALLIEGDRSGSGDRLNYLSVSVSGDWITAWQESSK
jgi:hypothetical protein